MEKINISQDDAIEVLWAIDRTIELLWTKNYDPLQTGQQKKILANVRKNISDQVLGLVAK